MADGDVGLPLEHIEDGAEDGAFRGPVAVVEAVGRRIHGNQLFAGHREVLQDGVVGVQLGIHHAHLGGHEAVGDAVVHEEAVEKTHIVAGFLRDDVQAGPRGKGGIHIHLAAVEAIAGIGRCPALLVEVKVPLVPGAEVYQVVVLQHHALGNARGTGGIQQDKEILRLGAFGNGTFGQGLQLVGGEHGSLVLVQDGQKLFFGNQKPGRCVLHHKVEALLRVGRIQRLIGTAGLEDAQGGQGHPLAAADEHGHHIFRLQSPGGDGRGDAVCEGIGLSVGAGIVLVADSRRIRRLSGLPAEEAYDGLGGVHFLGVMVEALQLLQALSVHEGHLIQFLVLQQASDHAFHSVGKGLHQGFAVFAVVIAQHNGLLPLATVNVDAQRELGSAGIHVFSRHRLSVYPVIGQHAHLVGQHHLRLEAELGGHLGEGIILVLQGGLEVLVALLQEGFGAFLRAVSGQGQGIHEHTVAFGRLQIAAAVADGADIDFLVGVVGAQGKVGGTQIETGGRDAHLLAEGMDIGLDKLSQVHLAAGLVAVFQVRYNGGRALQAFQLPGKEVPGLGVGLAAFGGFLPGGVLEIRIAFGNNVLALQRGADFLDEEVVAAAVKHQMVEIAQKAGLVLPGNDNYLPQRTFAEVEGKDEVLFQAFQFSLLDGNGDGNIRGNLAHLPVYLVKAGLQGGMGVQNFPDGLLQGLGRYFPGEGPHHRNIVDGFLRSLHTVQEHAGLLVGQGLGTERFFASLRMTGGISGHPNLENLVFNALEAGGFGKGVHIGLDAIALEQLGGQAQAAQGAEAVEHQGFGEPGAFYAGGFLEQGRELFFQEVERCGGLFLCPPGLRLGQGLHVHLLVDVERDGFYLHSNGRHHIRRLAFQDKGIEGGRVYLLVAYHIGCQEFAAAFLVKGLHGNVLDARELADGRFHLLQLYAEAADFHLGVFSAYIFDVSVCPVTHNVSGAVHTLVGRVFLVRIVCKGFGGLVRTAQIAVSHLLSGLQQFSGGAHGHAPAGFVHHIAVDAGLWNADGNVFFLLLHFLGNHVAEALGRAVAVEQPVAGQR